MENTTTLLPTNGTHSGLHTITTNGHREHHGLGLDSLINAIDRSSTARDIIGDIGNSSRDAIAATERNGGETRLAVTREAGETRANSERGLLTTLDRMASNHSVTIRELCDTQKDIIKENARTREKSAEQFSALQLQNCKDAAELARQIAECCCETKELVRAESTATRDLIQSNVADSLRAKITEISTANTILQLASGNGNSGCS